MHGHLQRLWDLPVPTTRIMTRDHEIARYRRAKLTLFSLLSTSNLGLQMDLLGTTNRPHLVTRRLPVAVTAVEEKKCHHVIHSFAEQLPPRRYLLKRNKKNSCNSFFNLILEFIIS